MISSFMFSIKTLIMSGFSPFKLLEEGLISFLLLIDAKIYSLFAYLYSLYIELAKARVFDIDAFSAIINNIYVLFGVVALFILAFTLLQTMVNPDDLNKSTNSIKHFVTRFILAIGLTCVTPTVFNFLYDFQAAIINYQVIPKAMIGTNGAVVEDLSFSVENEEGETVIQNYSDVDISSSILKSNGYAMAYYVLNGFLSPTNPDEDVVVDASEYFDAGSGVVLGAIGCGISALGFAVGVVLDATGAGAPLGVAINGISAGGMAAMCGAGIVGGVMVNGVLKEVTADEMTWSYASTLAYTTGDFDIITSFSSAVVDGSMEYTPIISTVAGCILLYMMFSFCLDLGIRAAKLVFYQLLAPISFLVSAIPSKKDLMSKWFKIVLATWFEVFTRIFCVCGVALLVSKLSYIEFEGLGLIAKAIIVLGLVAFAKQIPKLLGELTGINTGNMKLGIKDKLKEGGLFTAADKLNRFGAATASLVSGHGNPLAFKRGWKNGWSNVGGEQQRRQEKQDALAAGATRTQIMKDSIRKKFGFATDAEASLRDIDKEQENVTNRTTYDIQGTFVDSKGRTINGISSKQSTDIDASIIEGLEAQKTQNISSIAGYTDEIRALDKKIAYGGAQIKFKSNLKGEAEKKIDEAGSKVRYDFEYTDANGNVQKFNGTYGEIVEFRNRNLSAEQLAQAESLESIRDKMISQFIANELASSADNKTKQDLRAGFNTLINNNGYEYSYYDVDANGNKVIKTGKIAVSQAADGSYQVTDTRTAADGSQVVTDISSGKSEYEIVSAIDKLAKSSNGVLNDEKQRIDETQIDSYRGQNEAIDNIIKQYNEQKEAKRKSEEQRRKEASKKYTASRK